MSEIIKKGMAVSINYKLTDSKGDLLDESDQEPLQYLQGYKNIISGLEIALEGLKIGDKKVVVVPPEEGYGVYNPGKLQEVPLASFPDAHQLEVGMRFSTESDHGPTTVRIVELKEQKVVIDGNHPLAGETLNFDIEVVALRPATLQEMAHGHLHAHGHDH